MKKNPSTMIKTPNGIFDGLKVKAVTTTDSAVVVPGHDDKMLCWIDVHDEVKRKKISRALGECVYAASVGDEIDQIDWDAYELDAELVD